MTRILNVTGPDINNKEFKCRGVAGTQSLSPSIEATTSCVTLMSTALVSARSGFSVSKEQSTPGCGLQASYEAFS